jgi:hypothetical protein
MIPFFPGTWQAAAPGFFMAKSEKLILLYREPSSTIVAGEALIFLKNGEAKARGDSPLFFAQ